LEVVKIDLSFLKENTEIKNFKILITGVAGFIGSNLLESLLKEGFKVVGIDNFSTGSSKNIDDAILKSTKYNKKVDFSFIEGDIKNFSDCIKATKKIDVVFHQAALGSVQRSLEKPIEVNEVNVAGTMNMLKASVDSNVKRFIFASSSSVYGDSKILPKTEEMPLNPKSIYAATKMSSEYYVRLFYKIYGLKTISLRYFNVFGARQNPDSIYSAVIPIFLKNVKLNKKLVVFGNGEQSRDFTYIDNVIYANLLSMISKNNKVYGNFYNVGCGQRISLNEIISFLEKKINKKIDVCYQKERKGDVKSSLASLGKIKRDLEYVPLKKFYDGLGDLIEVFFKVNSI
jgi:UDP-N-acetylglucosamine/UDP-N-acetylgalactosamine 4-epimerase